METEESLVYQILDETNGGTINNDEPVGERLVRSFLREHRAEIIRKVNKMSYNSNGSEFQVLGIKTLTNSLSGLYVALPPIILLSDFSGLKITTASGNIIPVMTRDEYYRSKKNVHTGHLPKAHLQGGNLYVHSGIKNENYMNNGSGLNTIVDETQVDKEIYVEAILHNPDDHEGYDWTKDPYPLSAEYISELKQRVKKRNFGMILNTTEDEVANMKNDKIRYHDQGKVD